METGRRWRSIWSLNVDLKRGQWSGGWCHCVLTSLPDEHEVQSTDTKRINNWLAAKESSCIFQILIDKELVNRFSCSNQLISYSNSWLELLTTAAEINDVNDKKERGLGETHLAMKETWLQYQSWSPADALHCQQQTLDLRSLRYILT